MKEWNPIITITFDPESAVPLYEQIYRYIKAEIQNGGLPPNAKLPSKRKLSAHLQCSQNTVQNAYQQLLAEGYAGSKAKSGYYVCRLDGILKMDGKEATPYRKPAVPSACRYDFSYHGVDLEHFPFATLRRLTKEVINEYDPGLLRLGDPQGEYPLRCGIADYLRQSRGVHCSPEQIVVSSGTEFLLQLMIQLFPKNCVYALENPGYERLSQIFKSSRARFEAIPLDESGMMPDAVSKSRAGVLCVTPSHQFPTGTIMPVSRRIQLLNWANGSKDRYIIEDDYDSEFRYGGKPIPSLQGLDSGQKVIYIGAFSKSLTPAIRISYAVLPERLLTLYRKKLPFYLCPVPVLEQKLLCLFVSRGYFERHLNKMRNIYKKREKPWYRKFKNRFPA